MIYADWASDLSSLTLLILGTMAFVLAIIFRKELKTLLGRLTSFEWKEARVRAEPQPELAPASQPSGAGEESPEPSGDDKLDDGNAATITENAKDDDSEASIRAAMFAAFNARDRAEGERHFERLKTVVTDPGELKRDQARRLAALFWNGLDETALDSLRDLATDTQISSFANRMIGLCLSESGRIPEAAEAYKRSADQAPTPEYRALASALRASALTKLDQAVLAESELEELISATTDQEPRVRLWTALADVYEKTEKKSLRAIALHKVAEETGNDAGKWFNAAYAYANADSEGFPTLAIHCYRTALRFDPARDMALNNLGVEVGRKDMPIQAVDYYKRASEAGNTLAEANLAERYLTSGFTDDAQKIIDNALLAEDPDNRVTRVAAQIKDARETQTKKLSELSQLGDRAASFLSTLGTARLTPYSLDVLSGPWKLDGGRDFVVNLSSEAMEISWQKGANRPHRRFKGSVKGSAALGRFERESDWPSSDDEIHWKSDGDGYVVLGSDPIDIQMLRITSEDTEYFHAIQLTTT